MLSAKFSRKQLQVIRYFVIQSIIAQRGREEGWVATACYQNIVLIRDLKVLHVLDAFQVVGVFEYVRENMKRQTNLYLNQSSTSKNSYPDYVCS